MVVGLGGQRSRRGVKGGALGRARGDRALSHTTARGRVRARPLYPLPECGERDPGHARARPAPEIGVSRGRAQGVQEQSWRGEERWALFACWENVGKGRKDSEFVHARARQRVSMCACVSRVGGGGEGEQAAARAFAGRRAATARGAAPGGGGERRVPPPSSSSLPRAPSLTYERGRKEGAAKHAPAWVKTTSCRREGLLFTHAHRETRGRKQKGKSERNDVSRVGAGQAEAGRRERESRGPRAFPLFPPLTTQIQRKQNRHHRHSLHDPVPITVRAFCRIVTNSSAALGWIPTVPSNTALVAPALTATAKP